MKLFHISDLHLGKRLYDYSLIEDQAYILNEIINLAKSHRPDAILIAGDVYDKPVPPAEAVTVFDTFLCRLSDAGIKIFIISGNHDSPERLAFGGELMRGGGVYMSPVYNGVTEPFTVTDGFGRVNIYLLPFIKPAHVRRCFPDAEIESYTDAVRCAVEKMNIDISERNVIVTHQFITGAARSDSEEISVGGSDNVDVSVFDGFDYTALGHIHAPQKIGKSTVRYSGTPLKYSFSEISHTKSLTVVELGKKGDINVTEIPLKPLRDMRELRGSYDELTLRENYIGTNTDDYLHIILTDEEDIADASAKLQSVYKNLMKLDYDNKRTRASGSFEEGASEMPTPYEFFTMLYKKQNGTDPDDIQENYMKKLISKLSGGEGSL